MHFFLFSPQMFVTSVNNLKLSKNCVLKENLLYGVPFCRPHFKPIGKRVSCTVADEKKNVNILKKMKLLISVFRPNYLVTRLSSSSMEVFTII